MPRDEELADEDLAAAIDRVRSDPEFMERMARLIDRDGEILDRLANTEHRAHVDDASIQLQAAHQEALRRLGDS